MFYHLSKAHCRLELYYITFNWKWAMKKKNKNEIINLKIKDLVGHVYLIKKKLLRMCDFVVKDP